MRMSDGYKHTENPMIDDRRIIWLASYPKSGNTWVRALLGAFINDGPININAMPRPVSYMDLWPSHYQASSPRPVNYLEPDSILHLRGAALQHLLCYPDPLYVKTHMARAHTNGVSLIPGHITQGAIYIVRNPYDVAVSFAHHTGKESYDEAIEMMTRDNAILGKHGGMGLFHVLGRWDANVDGWLTQGLIPLMVRYEDLVNAPDQVLLDILEYLGYEQDEMIEERAAKAAEFASFEHLRSQEDDEDFQERRSGRFFRRGTDMWGDELTREQAQRIRSAFHETIDRIWPNEDPMIGAG